MEAYRDVPFQHILVPVDFSDRAHHAVGEAVKLARLLGADLTLYHVYARPTLKGAQSPDALEGILQKKTRDIDLAFENLKEVCPMLQEVSYTCEKELGISTERIPRYAKDHGTDLMIMATKGAQGIDELWGSKTATIIRKASCPVLVIPDEAGLNFHQDIAFCLRLSSKNRSEDITNTGWFGRKI